MSWVRSGLKRSMTIILSLDLVWSFTELMQRRIVLEELNVGMITEMPVRDNFTLPCGIHFLRMLDRFEIRILQSIDCRIDLSDKELKYFVASRKRRCGKRVDNEISVLSPEEWRFGSAWWRANAPG